MVFFTLDDAAGGARRESVLWASVADRKARATMAVGGMRRAVLAFCAICSAALQPHMRQHTLLEHGSKRCQASLLNAAADSTDDICLVELLSTCVDACERGMSEIRRVAAALERTDAGAVADVDYKIAGDARSALTAADVAAQAAIVPPLEAAWPGLVVVGEEDLACDVGAAADGAVCASELAVARAEDDAPLRRDRVDFEKQKRVATGRVAVFVDPLDGTREFVEGRLENVQTLVGVSVDGEAVAGAVGLPFGGADGAVVLFGLAGAGVGATAPRPPAAGDKGARPIVAAGDTDDATLRAAYAAALAGGGRRELVGGTGTKILAVVEGRADVAVMNFKSSAWDTCAPEALLRAAGGRLTDIFGEALVHRPRPRTPATYLNALGAVATGPGFGAAHGAVRDAALADPGARAKLRCWGLASDADDVGDVLARRRAALNYGA